MTEKEGRATGHMSCLHAGEGGPVMKDKYIQPLADIYKAYSTCHFES